jgi:methylmalonyl-CoA epimerase
MLTRVHHVGLVVKKLEDGLALWQDILGLKVSAQAVIEDQGVKAALLPIGRSEIELLEPISEKGGVAKFLETRGEGLHHVCFETPDVAAELNAARDEGFPLIDQAPRPGLAGQICFLHPKGTAAVLVEFATPPAGSGHHHGAGHGPLAGLALREVTSRADDPAAATTLFADKLGLVATGADGVSVGGVQLHFVRIDGQRAGLSGLVLEVDDLAAATGALAALAPTQDAGGLTLAVDRCHGVPLSVRGR